MPTPDSTPDSSANDTSGSAPENTPGRFVWHELMSSDPAASKAFYAGLFGWAYDVMPMPPTAGAPEGTPPREYPMIRAGESTIGGVMAIPAESQGMPAHWVGYVSVDDVDAAAQAAAENGGSVHMPATDIPEIGRFAIIADPSGASIALWKGAQGDGPEPQSVENGTFVWNELLTTDPETCSAFYPKLFDWKHESTPMPGPQGEMTYHLFKRSNQKEGCGMMQMPAESQAPSHWLPYVAVEDVDGSLESAKGLGAVVYCEPMDIPGVGRFAVLADPQGASFAIYKHAAAAESC